MHSSRRVLLASLVVAALMMATFIISGPMSRASAQTATATSTSTATGTATGTTTAVPSGTFITTPAFSSGAPQLAQVVFGGGTLAQLDAAMGSVGATGAWAQSSTGEFVLYISDAPAFANAPVQAAFPMGFAGPRALTLVRYPTIAVTAVDYAFQGLPASISAGSKVTLTNASAVEAHEFVAIRIPDSETRPVSQLVGLSDEEITEIFGETEPATVLIARPGETGMAVVGDGTLFEPGRYAVVCFIPQGADPDEIFGDGPEGPPEDGPPEGGPPHVALGMFAETNVP